MWAVRRSARRIACLALAAASFIACSSIRDVERSILYQPEHTTPDEAVAARIDGLERWWIDVEGGRVEAWFLPPIAIEGQRAPAVVFAHGNRELIEMWPERLRTYREMGFAILLPEYRSYGRSAGTPSEEAIVADFAAFYDRLVARPEIDRTRIVLHGRSLGGGVAAALSTRRPSAALILESTFTNVPDVASAFFTPELFLEDHFDTREVLMQSSTPTLIIHGVRDETIPFKHARELHRVAYDARVVAFRAGHNDVPRTASYWRAIRELLVEASVINPG
jgi:pimeloyl-ACP methyl ester carboxylesterase